MKTDKEKKDLLVFGWGLALIAMVFGVLGVFKHGWVWPHLVQLACSGVFAGVTAVSWQSLRPGYTGWMKVAHLIGGVVTAVILSMVFFCVFAPVGLILRLAGRDHLHRRLDRSAGSYWIVRQHDGRDRERYLQQF